MEIMSLKSNSEISLLLTDDLEMQKLNKRYRKIDSPTDVLAFSFLEEKETSFTPFNEILLGDIVISIDTAERQAQYWGHSLEIELIILMIHGFLHLLGYDHIKKNDAQVMKKREQHIFQIIKDSLDHNLL